MPLLGREGGRIRKQNFRGTRQHMPSHVRTRRVFGRAAGSLVFVPSLVRPARGRSSIHHHHPPPSIPLSHPPTISPSHHLTSHHLTIPPSHLPSSHIPSHHPTATNSPIMISLSHHFTIRALSSIALEGIRIETFFFCLSATPPSLIIRFLSQPVRFLPSPTQSPAWLGGDDGGDDDNNPYVLEYVKASLRRRLQ